MIPLLVLLVAGAQGRVPQPTDCSKGHNQVQTYCGVQFLCKCVKDCSPFYEELNPSCAFEMEIRGELTKLVPLVLNEDALSAVQQEPEENETEEEEDEIWDLLPSPPVYLDDAVPKRTEDLDTFGCGWMWDEVDERVTVRVAKIKTHKGRWLKVALPGNIIAVLKAIHFRTNGKCQYINQLPFNDCLEPATLGENADDTQAATDEKLYFQVEVADWRLRDSAISTVDQDYRMYYNKTSSSCYRGLKREDIICHL